MNFYAQSVEIMQQDSALRLAFAATSAGDRSTLHPLLDMEDACAVTTQDSPNHHLWQCFARHGWMEIGPADIRSGLPIPMLSTSLTERGRRCLPVILPMLQQWEAQQRGG